MNIVKILLLLLAMAPSLSAAQWYDRKTGATAPDAEWRRSDGDLGVMLVLTQDANGFLKQWQNTPEQHAPNITTAESVKRGESITALVFFSGCGLNEKPCNAVLDFKVLKPDGGVYADIPNNKVWPNGRGKRGVVYLSQAMLRIEIEPQDPIGVYSIFAEFRDSNTGKLLKLKKNFEVVR